ncbi:hypothetical protein P7C71_g6190, partial [Lecanoromycetidae sp. Uapishka_2]
MTGLSADAEPLPPTTEPEVHETFRDNDEPYNFLDVEVMPNRLRNRSKSSRWTDTVIQDDDTSGNYGQRRELVGNEASSTPNGSARRPNAYERDNGRASSNIQEDSSSDSGAPLSTRKSFKEQKRTPAAVKSSPNIQPARKRGPTMPTPEAPQSAPQLKKHRPTPATTATPPAPQTRLPSTAPIQTQIQAVIPIDSDSEGENKPVKIKAEPLSSDALTKTILLVKASTMDKAPLTVPLSSYSTPSLLFSTLLRDLRLPQALHQKVHTISATYAWNGKELLIRKNDLDDWKRFCKAVRSAWETLADNFNDENECEVRMVVHVDN